MRSKRSRRAADSGRPNRCFLLGGCTAVNLSASLREEFVAKCDPLLLAAGGAFDLRKSCRNSFEYGVILASAMSSTGTINQNHYLEDERAHQKAQKDAEPRHAGGAGQQLQGARRIGTGTRVSPTTARRGRTSPCKKRYRVESGDQQVFFDVVAHQLRERLPTHRLQHRENSE